MGMVYDGSPAEYDSVLETINLIFTFIFIFECVLKLTAFGFSGTQMFFFFYLRQRKTTSLLNYFTYPKTILHTVIFVSTQDISFLAGTSSISLSSWAQSSIWWWAPSEQESRFSESGRSWPECWECWECRGCSNWWEICFLLLNNLKLKIVSGEWGICSFQLYLLNIIEKP